VRPCGEEETHPLLRSTLLKGLILPELRWIVVVSLPSSRMLGEGSQRRKNYGGGRRLTKPEGKKMNRD
jgi:hypothetical protein